MKDPSTHEAMSTFQAYLQWIVRDFSTLPVSLHPAKSIQQMYQPVHCTLYKQDFHDPRSQEYAFLFSSLPDVMEHNTAFLFDAFSLSFWNDDIEYTYMKTLPFYHYYVDTPLIWEQVREEKQHLILLGQHGSGKSSLLRHEAYRVAQEQLARLAQAGSASQLAFAFPLYLSLEQLTWALQAQPTRVYDAIVDLLRTIYPLSDTFADWLKAWLPTNRVLYLFDALDTVAPDLKPLLTSALEQLDHNPACRIIIASCPHGYEGIPFASREQARVQEIELLGFARAQWQPYLLQWFPQQPEEAQALLQMIEQDPMLQMMAQVPFLLSLLCLVFSREHDLPRTYTALYQHAIQMVLGSVIQEHHHPRSSDLMRTRSIATLEQIAWQVTHLPGQWPQLFSEADITNREMPDEFAETTTPLRWFESAGLLRLVSIEEKAISTPDPCYRFCSPSLQCYLVACFLARQPRQLWVTLLHSQSRLNPYWQNILSLLFGLVDDPQELFESFEQQRFQETATVFLLARAVREVRRSATQERIRNALARELVMIAYTGSRKEKRQATALLIQLRGTEIRETLLNLIHDPQSSPARQSAVLLALGQLGDPSTFDVLLAVLGHRETTTGHQDLIDSASPRMAAVWALGQGDEIRAIEALIQIISDDTEARPLQWAATWMLGQRGAKQAVEPLRTILQRCRTQPKNLAITYLRDAAIWALGNLKDERVVHDLIAIALDEGEQEPLCAAAFRALQRLGSLALPALAQQVVNPSVSEKGRASLIETLCQINSEQAEKRLQALMAEQNDTALQAVVTHAWNNRTNVHVTKKAKKNHPAPQVLQASIELLLDKQAPLDERRSAIWRLRDEDDHHIFECLLRLAEDQTEATALREHALVHAWIHGESEMWPVLSKILQDKQEPEILRRHAADCLNVKGPHSADVFLHVIRDESDVVREATAQALGNLGDLRAVDGLLEMIHPVDESRQILLYENALEALAKFQDAQTSKRVRAMIQTFLPSERERYLCYVAMYALSQGTDEIIAMEMAWRRLQGQELSDFVTDLLAFRYPQAANILLQRWQQTWKDDEEIGGETLIVLGQLGYCDAMDDLFQALWTQTGVLAGVRRAATAFGFAFMGFATLMNVLQSMLNESSCS